MAPNDRCRNRLGKLYYSLRNVIWLSAANKMGIYGRIQLFYSNPQLVAASILGF
jgi:hypothetical protein